MATWDPIYHKDWPEVHVDEWFPSTDFDLGWISNLYKISNKTLPTIYGDYSEFRLDDDNVLDLDNLDSELYVEGGSVGPVVYLSVWLAIMVLFGIVGFGWCLCHRCCCCCRSSLNRRSLDELKYTDPSYQLRPHYYSERNDKSGRITHTAIILSGLMAVWLVAFLIIIFHTFAANGKTKEAVENIRPDVDSILNNTIAFIIITRKQLDHTFIRGIDEFAIRVQEIINKCDTCQPTTSPGITEPPGDPLEPINMALASTRILMTDSNEALDNDLAKIQNATQDSKNTILDDFETSINNVNEILYWFFLIFNLLYCLVFILVLFGTVFAAFSRRGVMKDSGFLLIRGGMVIMFIVAILVILQLMTMFIVAGLSSEIFCPAFRKLEDPPVQNSKEPNPDPPSGDYEIPGFGKILRACRNNTSVYSAFELHKTLPLEILQEIVKVFDNIGDVPAELLQNIKDEAQRYVNYVKYTLEHEMGKCYPVYLAANTTLNLFCHKLTAPVASYWYILQFIPLIFVLVFFTAVFFERLHS